MLLGGWSSTFYEPGGAAQTTPPENYDGYVMQAELKRLPEPKDTQAAVLYHMVHARFDRAAGRLDDSFNHWGEAVEATTVLVPDSIEGSKVRKDTDSLNATSRFRVLGNIIKQIRVFLSEARAWCAQGSTSRWIRP